MTTRKKVIITTLIIIGIALAIFAIKVAQGIRDGLTSLP
jgi:hypothetical protein